jgi:hypothetical protein
MGRHQPARLRSVRNDEGLDFEGGTKLVFEHGPERGKPALNDYVSKVGTCTAENTVISVELPIGEPESVVSARIEPAAIVFLRLVTQDCRGSAKVVGNAVNKLKQIVSTSVKDRISFFESVIERPKVFDSCPIEARCWRFGSEGA